MKRTKRASFRTTNGVFTRFVLIEDGSLPREQRRYYTGDHSSKNTLWSKDQRQAMLYAHLPFVLFDLTNLQAGWLPEGRRGMVACALFADDDVPESWKWNENTS